MLFQKNGHNIKKKSPKNKWISILTLEIRKCRDK